ncbi:hypothetical protein Patl1_31273 [Pistacia atlantica]|uniref:Uncharacterized protein n=1 Tax=Pistacia atlantica TaxID=434234 RepID=A0ACC1AC47_9ROSI|nr:hypothetical protein Patl1_31273 [Pistacia atlantica]
MFEANLLIFCRHNNYIQNNARTIHVQNIVSSIPNYGVFGALIPLLVTVLQLHVLGTTNSVFETHPINMWIFLVAAIIHYFVFSADLKFKLQYHSTLSHVCSAIGSISGSLASAALISVIPHSNGCIVFIAWAFVPIFVVYKNAIAIKDAFDRVYQKSSGMEMEYAERIASVNVADYVTRS